MPIEKQFTIGGDEIVDMLLTSATSNGKLSVFISNCPPNAGPPPHIHTLEDEFFLPLEGEFEMFDGEHWSALGKDGMYAPRNHVHTWRNSGKARGRLLTIATGNSFDVFLEKFGAMRLPEQMREVIAMSAEHGISYVLPNMPSTAEAMQAVEEPELAVA